MSVSRPYLALDGIYLPIGLHSQTTRLADSASWCDKVRARRGSHPLRHPFTGDLIPVRRFGRSPYYNSDGEAAQFSSWAIPGSLAVTRGVLLASSLIVDVGPDHRQLKSSQFPTQLTRYTNPPAGQKLLDIPGLPSDVFQMM
ncbi:hypothetical protein BUALT_Bualt11G0066600 [Buddleja alternifolia]|uniref:Uncharacterized protein n=1 Tax=Buddleja alternifolia TaxID=168488 RepID=A0AAV6WTG2_9LAMI|nr:hypothetical protein BUALT_Bualt11G0066600 [Buddleja alternifolia]